MVSKIKLKNLFADNLKKFKSVEKSNPELNLYGVLFELSCCHNMTLEDIHKTLSKIKTGYMDFNEFRVTEVDDICEDFNMPNSVDDILTFIQCLDDVFEKNGTVDLDEISKYDEAKISTLFSRLSGNINGSCYSYYLNRLGKEGPYVFSDNQVRILKRLKIVDENEEFDVVKKKVEKIYPKEKGVSFFLACQAFANEYCRDDNPSCTRCPFIVDCEFGKNIVKEREEKEKEREIVRQKALEEEQRKIDSEKKKNKSSKKKDKNEDKEGVEIDGADNLGENQELSKKELKKLKAAQDALEKQAKKLEAKMLKKKLKEEAAELAKAASLAAANMKKALKAEKNAASQKQTVTAAKNTSLKNKKLAEKTASSEKKANTLTNNELINKKGDFKKNKKKNQVEIAEVIPQVTEILTKKSKKDLKDKNNLTVKPKIGQKQDPIEKAEAKKQIGKVVVVKINPETKITKAGKKEKVPSPELKVIKKGPKTELLKNASDKKGKNSKTESVKSAMMQKSSPKETTKKVIKKEIKVAKPEKKDKAKSIVVKKEKVAKQVKVEKAPSKKTNMKKANAKKKK